MQSLTPVAVDAISLVSLDPTTLLVDNNIRSSVGDITSLVASIREVGVLVPILVRPEGDTYRVIAGSRRTAAAIEVGCLIPAIVREGIDDDLALVEAQLIENLARRDLTVAEEVKAFEQLSAFGLTNDEIAAIATVDVDKVVQGRRVAASVPTLKLVDEHPLTLDQAAVLAEFEDDQPALDVLLTEAQEDPGNFPHLVAEIRSDREQKARAEQMRTELTEAGVKILDTAPGWNPTMPNCRISELGKNGKSITVAQHRKCPGHAAFVLVGDRFRKSEVVYVCVDPKANGHAGKLGAQSTSSGKTDEQKEAKSEERRDVLAGNKAWRAAEPIRRKFVIDLLKRKTVPKGMLAFVAAEVLGDPSSVFTTMIDNDEAMLAGLLGVKLEAKMGNTAPMSYGRFVGLREASKRGVNDARRVMILFAQIAAARENTMSVHTWRADERRDKKPSPAKRYLDFLDACGYRLAEIEKKVP